MRHVDLAWLSRGQNAGVEPDAIPRPFSGPRYSENSDRCGDSAPCAICGSPCYGPTVFLRVIGGGREFALHDAPDDGGGEMGFFPIGSTCLRKWPALKAMAVRVEVLPKKGER